MSIVKSIDIPYTLEPMDTFGFRLKLARKEAKLSQSDVQRKIGIKQGTLSELENDLTLKSTYTIALADLYDVDATWLATGRGNKTSSHRPANSYKVNTDRRHYPPVYGKAMGGLPDCLYTDEDRLINGHDQFGEIYSSDEKSFIVKIEGNSMFPKYFHGGYALVEPGTTIDIEDELLIKLNTGQVLLKKLVSRRGGVVLGSYNDPDIYTYDESEITWMYYVAYPVPSKKIKNRM